MNIIEVPIEKIANWKDNPKSIKEEDLKRLKYQIKELGVYKPLLVTRALKKDKVDADYISLGGNQRLKAFAELKTSIIPCSLVKADTQKKRIEYSLSDNDRAGSYNRDQLNDLIFPQMDNLDLDMFKLDLGELTGLDEFMTEAHIDKLKDGEEIIVENSVQLEPPKEYILLMVEPNSPEWEDIKQRLQLKMVRRGGYKTNSPLQTYGIERVIWWDDFKERYDAHSDSK